MWGIQLKEIRNLASLTEVNLVHVITHKNTVHSVYKNNNEFWNKYKRVYIYTRVINNILNVSTSRLYSDTTLNSCLFACLFHILHIHKNMNIIKEIVVRTIPRSAVASLYVCHYNYKP